MEFCDLTAKDCVPCRGGVPALEAEQIARLLDGLGNDWRAVGEHHIEKEYPFDDFAGALAFVNQVGVVADCEGHHPEIHLTWGMVKVTVYTRKIAGLTESDFVLAAKIEEARRGESPRI